MSKLNLREWRWILRHIRYTLSAKQRLQAWRQSWRDWRRFWDSYQRYWDLHAESASAGELRARMLPYLFPCVQDATATTPIEPTYFYQDSWAFGHIVKQKPASHVDVGSHHKFVALLSKVLPVTMVDIRPLSLPLDTLNFCQGSILDLPYEDGSVPSLSSLCVVEHIGLGRYGDPLDPQGTEKALHELKRVMAPGGDLYLSIPVDDENRTYFNAHRAFAESYLLELFKPFELIETRYIYGYEFGDQPRSGFGTGCFWLRKPAA